MKIVRSGGKKMDQAEMRLAKASANRAKNRAKNRENGPCLKKGEQIVGLEEFLKRISLPGRKWVIAGGNLRRQFSRGKDGEPLIYNLAGCQITSVETNGNALNFIHEYWPGFGGCPGPRDILITIENFNRYTFTSKSKKHLGIRFTEGDFSGFTALTLIDEKTEEEDRAEARRIAAEASRKRIYEESKVLVKEHEAKLQKFFDGLPIRLELVGYSYYGRQIKPSSYALHRTDNGTKMTFNVANWSNPVVSKEDDKK